MAKRGPGRPALPEFTAKSKMFAVRLSVVDFVVIDAAAKLASKSMGEYVREKLVETARQDLLEARKR